MSFILEFSRGIDRSEFLNFSNNNCFIIVDTQTRIRTGDTQSTHKMVGGVTLVGGNGSELTRLPGGAELNILPANGAYDNATCILIPVFGMLLRVLSYAMVLHGKKSLICFFSDGSKYLTSRFESGVVLNFLFDVGAEFIQYGDK